MRKMRALTAPAALLSSVTLVGLPAGGGLDPDPPPKHARPRLVPDTPGSAGYADEGASPTNQAAWSITRVARPKDGYASSTVYTDERRIDLWWYGPVDDDVRHAIDEASEKFDVNVIVRPAGTSWKRMKSLHTRLIEHEEVLARKGVAVHSMTSPSDLSSIDIRIHPSVGPRTEAEKNARRDVARQEAQRIVDVPISSVREVSAPEPLAGMASCCEVTVDPPTQRQNDSGPFYGGAMIINSQGVPCSTGFSLSDLNNKDFTVTASHCNIVPGVSSWQTRRTWYNGQRDRADGDPAGTLVASYDETTYDPDTASTDTLRIDTWVDAFMWCLCSGTEGDPPNAVQTRNAVALAGWATMSAGETVRSNGARSGRHDVIRVDSHNATWTCLSNPSRACSGVYLIPDTASGNTQAARGDSGGPLYVNVPGDDPRVMARGLINHGVVQAYNGCSEELRWPNDPDPKCYSEFYAVDIMDVLAQWSADVMSVPWP